MLRVALFPSKLASHLWFVYLCIPFYVESGTKSGSGTGMHSSSYSNKAKSTGWIQIRIKVISLRMRIRNTG